ncbi:hypothetical protein DBV15_01617 [Temnothorax longispinosus]|uniref:Uncharacterized protein n=1 Tax=Temnothorax longispinosus TaxID=300112 RepID=A0A4S2KTR6_9HYME|nr:hypothetical protein DBV15_01617 [Temnothorax longispinosus]
MTHKLDPRYDAKWIAAETLNYLKARGPVCNRPKPPQVTWDEPTINRKSPVYTGWSFHEGLKRAID